MPLVKALRASAVTFRGNPFHIGSEALVYEPDALVVIREGVIAGFGAYQDLAPTLPEGVDVVRYENAIVMAGFVDAHVHYPQLPIVGAYGEQLLEWLDAYVFPAEAKFADKVHADRVAELFLRELLRAGTTTAAVYCTVHPQSVDSFFQASERFNTLMVAGKVLMDRHAPADLKDTAQTGYDESKALIRRWHGRGRQHYSVTPRFAPTSTDAQLESAGALLREHDGLFLQTHIAENLAECAWVAELFPERSSYLDVYAHAGLVGPRTVLGHGVHLAESDFCTCHATGAALAHCPTSNLFLGSGLFRLHDALDPRRPIRVGLGTDVGAGTSLSQLASLNEGYKVAQLQGRRLSAPQAFWLATAGGAEALHLEHRIGTIAVGHDADLVVLDTRATPLMRFRADCSRSIEDLLFALMTLGDDRMVRTTIVAGETVYDRDRDGDQFHPLEAPRAETPQGATPVA